MKLIPLTQGEFALVDDSDFEYLSQWKWHLSKRRSKHYAARNRSKRELEGPHLILMHREVCAGPMVDHRDGNGLNNQRDNLRTCTNSQNLHNRGAQTNNTSGVKGVCWDKANNKWLGQLRVAGKNIKIGRFDTIEEAESAYIAASKKHVKDFSNPNGDTNERVD